MTDKYVVLWVKKSDWSRRGILVDTYTEEAAHDVADLRNETFTDDHHFVIELPKECRIAKRQPAMAM